MVSGARTVAAIERAVTSQRVKPALLFIDYLQLLSGKGRDQRERIEGISAGLKQLAADHLLPVVCLSSLRRPHADAKDAPPTLSDLRESGELEHDADVILLLHRASLPMGMLSPDAICIIAKARDAEMGVVKMRFDPAYLRYSETTERE
jgi:replicative DNA helicase